ncbi:MAG: cobalamin-binding protein [Gammaproteobacteria bacterium]|nr:cobalamin-binding protein [Gammaproteobacteria bacterium]NIR83129.1 cobalamin-binding protein [Gammaproteobacteria bacterium]NIR90937.1 cobalamin-binding protein [Gammaproteobacteria bacterium]NIU04294.1 cobalamin-binding protein [Gammaproteobacteria bacterium]NIV52517.1 ABC transporter substrate-binding protein [Gammaproteobacteria bacterium]
MSPQPRVVSLLASATEIVCALGLESHLVGRSHECDYPASVRRLPACSEPEIDITRPSAEIDRDVRERVKAGLSVYKVSEAALRELQPDLILTQTQCEVCAVTPRDVEDAVCEWTGRRPRIVSLEPVRLDDVWKDIQRIGAALDAEQRARRLVARLQERMHAVVERARTRASRPGVGCIEWVDPLIGAGNWIPELVEMAGAENVFGAAGEHAPQLEWEELVRADPQVMAIMPCGYDLATTRRDAALLAERAQWPALRAVRGGRVAVIDGNQYLNRSGPRLVESLEILAEIFHPDVFDFGHRGRAWEWF